MYRALPDNAKNISDQLFNQPLGTELWSAILWGSEVGLARAENLASKNKSGPSLVSATQDY